MDQQQYHLQLQIRIQAADTRGYPLGGGLEIREDATLTASGFMEVAEILSQFHKLIQSMQGS